MAGVGVGEGRGRPVTKARQRQLGMPIRPVESHHHGSDRRPSVGAGRAWPTSHPLGGAQGAVAWPHDFGTSRTPGNAPELASGHGDPARPLKLLGPVRRVACGSSPAGARRNGLPIALICRGREQCCSVCRVRWSARPVVSTRWRAVSPARRSRYWQRTAIEPWTHGAGTEAAQPRSCPCATVPSVRPDTRSITSSGRSKARDGVSLRLHLK